MQLQVALGVAPAQVGVEHLAGQVVGEQPRTGPPRRRRARRSQPNSSWASSPSRAPRPAGPRWSPGRGRRPPGPGGGGGWAGAATNRSSRARTTSGRCSGREGGRVAPAGRHVGHQRQGQGMAVGEGQGGAGAGRPGRRGRAGRPGLSDGPQVAQRDHPGPGPASRGRASQPAAGRVTAGEHDQVAAEAARAAASPAARPSSGARRLVGVDQQHGPGAGGPGRPSAPDASGGSSRARPRTARNPGGDGSTARTSSRTAATPASAASRANSPSRTVLPTPPGPCTWRRANGGSGVG